MFLRAKQGDVKESTVRAYKFPTKHFVEFCEEYDVTPVGEVNDYVLESWKESRKKEDIQKITLHNNVKHLRVFIRWCEGTGLIESGTADRMSVPQVDRSEAVSDVTLSLTEAERTLRYLKKYKYASRQHAVFYTLWHTSCRASGAIALDLQDLELNPEGEAVLKFRDRKSQGTPLKNGPGGERNVTIKEGLRDVLVDYIEGRREGATDEFDRDPLFTTASGRVSRQRIYKNVTGLTRPCLATDSCPHDRRIEDCTAAQKKREAFGCPSSVGTHPIRRGSITYHINRGWPKEKLSERVDVSVDVLSKHYDARKKEDERNGRKEFIDLL